MIADAALLLIAYFLWRLQRYARSIDCVMRFNKIDDLMALWAKIAKEADPSATHLTLDDEQHGIIVRLRKPLA